MSNHQAPSRPLFQVIRRGPRPNKSVTLPAGITVSAGTAYQEASGANVQTPADQDFSGGVVLADGTRPFAGFVTRDVAVGVPVPTYSELSVGGNPSLPLETKFQAGGEGSLEDADEYECEGSEFISSGTGSSSGTGARDISPASAIGSVCSFYNGRTAIAAAGQYGEFELAEIQVPSIPGNMRARFRRIYGVTA